MKRAPQKYYPRAGKIKRKSRLFFPERSKASRGKSTEEIACRSEGLLWGRVKDTQGVAQGFGIDMVTKLSENECTIGRV